MLNREKAKEQEKSYVEGETLAERGPLDEAQKWSKYGSGSNQWDVRAREKRDFGINRTRQRKERQLERKET